MDWMVSTADRAFWLDMVSIFEGDLFPNLFTPLNALDGLKKLVSHSNGQESLKEGNFSEQDPMGEDNDGLFGSEADNSEEDIAYSGEDGGSEGTEEGQDDNDATARDALRRMLAEFGPP